MLEAIQSLVSYVILLVIFGYGIDLIRSSPDSAAIDETRGVGGPAMAIGIDAFAKLYGGTLALFAGSLLLVMSYDDVFSRVDEIFPASLLGVLTLWTVSIYALLSPYSSSLRGIDESSAGTALGVLFFLLGGILFALI